MNRLHTIAAAALLAAGPAFAQIVPQPPQPASAPTALPAHDVRAKALKETATGPVAGYRATRSATIASMRPVRV